MESLSLLLKLRKTDVLLNTKSFPDSVTLGKFSLWFPVKDKKRLVTLRILRIIGERKITSKKSKNNGSCICNSLIPIILLLQ
jgi:hypothetical protein